jgi:YVTN family beta-propeller protein
MLLKPGLNNILFILGYMQLFVIMSMIQRKYIIFPLILTLIFLILFSFDAAAAQSTYSRGSHSIVNTQNQNLYSSKTLIADIKVGKIPVDIAVNPTTNKVYVANRDSNTLSVIDGKTNSNATKNIQVGAKPIRIAVNPTTNKIYVANYGDGTVSVIDGNTNSVIANLTIGGRLFAVAVNPNTNKVYVANDDSNFVYIIDGNENIVTKMLKIFFTNIKFPKIFVNPNTNKVYIPLNDIKRIYSIDGNTNNIAIIPLDILEQLSEIAINVNRNEIYIANYRSGTVYVIDGNTNNIVAEIDVGVKKFPDVMSIDPITNKLYMVHSDPRSEGTVSVIDVQAKKSKNVPIANAAVKSGDEPVDISVNPNTNKIYVANYRSGTVSVIDGKTNSNATNIQIGAEPIAIAVNAKTNKIYVANNGSGTVSVINGETNRVIPEIKVGIYPRDIGINPVTNKIYVANYGSGTVSVIDGNIDKVIQNISVGDHPRALDVNAKTNKIYVANTGSNAVSVIDGNTDSVIAEIKLRQYPFFVSIDPNTNKVFVANIAHMSGSNYNTVDSTKNSTVSVIDGNIDKVIQNISVGDGPIALAVMLCCYRISICNKT